jgi:hypothetical protein
MLEYCPECYIVKGVKIELEMCQTSFGRDYLYYPSCQSEIRLLTPPDETEEDCPSWCALCIMAYSQDRPVTILAAVSYSRVSHGSERLDANQPCEIWQEQRETDS